MKRSAKYTDKDLGKLAVVHDFLPPPDQLVLRDEGVKVTLSLSKRSIAFFKAQASKSKVPYQKMIRNLVDSYASRYSGKSASTRASDR